MIRIFVDQHMGQKAGACSAALDRSRRQWGLVELLTAGADQARTHDPVHHEAAGDVFQLLGHVFAKPLQPATARSTGIAHGEHRLMARQVIRQGPALRLALVVGWRSRILLNRRFRRQGDLLLFQRQFKLIEALGARPKPMAAQPRELMLQRLDEKLAGLQLRHQRRDQILQNRRIIRQRLSVVEHGDNLPDIRQYCNPRTASSCCIKTDSIIPP